MGLGWIQLSPRSSSSSSSHCNGLTGCSTAVAGCTSGAACLIASPWSQKPVCAHWRQDSPVQSSPAQYSTVQYPNESDESSLDVCRFVRPAALVTKPWPSPNPAKRRRGLFSRGRQQRSGAPSGKRTPAEAVGPRYVCNYVRVMPGSPPLVQCEWRAMAMEPLRGDEETGR